MDAGIVDLPLRSHQPLRHGRRWNEKRARDFVGFEAAQRTKGQCDLGFERERGVAAGEDQSEAVIGNVGCIDVGSFDLLTGRENRIRLEFFRECRLPPDAIDGFVPGRLDEPCARVFRDAGQSPLSHSRCKRFLGDFFGKVEVCEEANQRRHDSAPIGSIDVFNRNIGVQEHTQRINRFFYSRVDFGIRCST